MLKHSWLAVGLLAHLLFPLAPGARADSIDTKLLPNAAKVLRLCHQAGHKKLGVLKFAVQFGEGPASTRVGLFNAIMATKLENALVQQMSPDDRETLITRGASAHVGKLDPKANFATPEAGLKLFTHSYPLAWGDRQEKVDAFLTGLVVANLAELRSTVIIQVFDRNNPEPREIVRFIAPLDRQVLADLNLAVSVVRRDMNPEEKGITIDPDSIRLGGANDKPKLLNPNPKPKTSGAAPTFVAVQIPSLGPKAGFAELLDFKVHYRGRVIPWSDGQLAEPPRPGDPITFTVHNKSRKRLGLILRVNGVSTWGDLRDLELREMPNWVLEPGRDYTIDGFYPLKGDKYLIKGVAPEALNPSLASSTKLGFIDLDLFYEAGETPEIKIPSATSRTPSLRSVTETMARAADLRKKMSAPTDRSFIDRDPNPEPGKVDIVRFQRGVPGPRLTLQYQVTDKGPQIIPE